MKIIRAIIVLLAAFGALFIFLVLLSKVFGPGIERENQQRATCESRGGVWITGRDVTPVCVQPR